MHIYPHMHPQAAMHKSIPVHHQLLQVISPVHTAALLTEDFEARKKDRDLVGVGEEGGQSSLYNKWRFQGLKATQSVIA